MEHDDFVNVEFVVVETKTEPWYFPVQKHVHWESAGLTTDRARFMLSELLRCPVQDVGIVDQVGRAYLVTYEPLGHADPDIVLCVWPSARPVQRAILDIQEARAVNARSWSEWWNMIDGYVRDLKKILDGARVSGEERAFVLDWAYRVRDTGAALVEHGRKRLTDWG